MSDAVVESLILDLLEWISNRPKRTYQEVMDAWRTSCPRLPVWEDANARGLVVTGFVDGHDLVRLTPAGVAYLARRGAACRDSRRSAPLAQTAERPEQGCMPTANSSETQE